MPVIGLLSFGLAISNGWAGAFVVLAGAVIAAVVKAGIAYVASLA